LPLATAFGDKCAKVSDRPDTVIVETHLRIADCGSKLGTAVDCSFNPQSAIRNPQSVGPLHARSPDSGNKTMADLHLRAALQHIRSLAERDQVSAQSDGALLRAYQARGDETAFRAIVERHGPLIKSVCWRVLHNVHDAEDAFQATFIFLARTASTISKPESLGSWLHGVAYRVATNARRAAGRRRRHEFRSKPASQSAPVTDVSWREVQALLDEEIQKLPEVYRSAVLLCCLENRPSGQVARDLGVKEGTVWSRVAKARGLLRKKFELRGVPLAAVLGAVVLSENGALATVPEALLTSTVCAATRLADRPLGALGEVVSPRVASLVKGANRTMLFSKVKTVTFVILALALGGAGLGLAANEARSPAEPRSAIPTAGAREDPRPGSTVPTAVKADEPAWKKEFSKAYALADGEILKRVAPPYLASRSDFFKDTFAGRKVVAGDAVPPMEEWYCAFRFKDAKVKMGPMRIGVKPETGIALRDLFDMVIEIPSCEVEANDELFKRLVSGDFVLREGADPVKVVAKLQDILQNECKLDVKLTFPYVEREVVVARGKFKVKPLDPKKNRVEVYAVELAERDLGGGGRGALPEFLRNLNAFINLRTEGTGTTRIVNDAEFDPKEQINWHFNLRLMEDGSIVDWNADHEPTAVLANVATQTGLTFKTEKRKVRVLFVEANVK
jgi:RNA polymerase sigma factor (sigma-70 family)